MLSLPGPRCAQVAPWLLSASQQRGAVREHPRFWSLHDVCHVWERDGRRSMNFGWLFTWASSRPGGYL